MAGSNQPQEMKSLIRMIEYHGTEEWLEKVMSASKIPFQGVLQMPNGFYIKSGIVMWEEAVEIGRIPDHAKDEIAKQADETSLDEVLAAMPDRTVVDQPAEKKPMVFKRPGEK